MTPIKIKTKSKIIFRILGEIIQYILSLRKSLNNELLNISNLGYHGAMKIHAFRLTPGQDLKKEIDAFSLKNKIRAGVVITCVGNVTKATLRMAGGKVIKTFDDAGSYEIVSLVGTLNNGYSHLHMVISDNAGKTLGGHIKENTIVGVTAEVVIGEITDMVFTRELDSQTGYEELVVKSK